MLVVYIVGSILVWAVIAFGVAALNRGTLNRNDAHLVAWITAFWPITIPVIAALAVVLCVIYGGVWLLEHIGKGIGKLGGKYIDFIQGRDDVVLPHPASGDRVRGDGYGHRAAVCPSHARSGERRL